MELVADIGATNARFQYCRDGDLLGAPVILPTGNYDTAGALLRDAVSALGEAPLGAALLAVAGPALDEAHIQLTNTGLEIGQAQCSDVLGCTALLVNDFFALAHGVPYFTRLEQLGGAAARPMTKAVLGPGSGLGMATLVNVALPQSGVPVWQVVASEGGHADLAPGTHLEAELWNILMAAHQHVCWELVLSGPGLQNLYTAMCALWGNQPQALTPAEICARGQDMTDPVCHQTLETFCALLGAAAGNLAVTVAAAGGVYIGGGIITRILDFLHKSPLRRRFEERGAMTEFVSRIPLLVITEPQPGLLGAARCLQRLRARGVIQPA